MGFSKTLDQQQALGLVGGQEKNVLLFGGSRSGKTFILLYSIVIRALKAPGSRHGVFRACSVYVKEAVMMDTMPKMMKICFPEVSFKQNVDNGVCRMSNGSEVWFCGLDDKKNSEKILGKEFATVYFNECSEISYPAMNLAMTRLAQKAPLFGREGFLPLKAYFDCNPPGKSHWSYKMFIQKVEPETNIELPFPEHFTSMLMNPEGNRDNIGEGYIEYILGSLPERKRQRFLEGNWLDDIEGALWQRAMINNSRIINVPELERIVIGVDPAITANASSNETGIIVAGKCRRGQYYILNDVSLKGSPLEWASAVEREYKRWKADRVICEVNNGGNLVTDNLRNVNPNISCKSVTASRGKIVRAEPIAALYEQGKVHHVGTFSKLEDQLCSYNPAMIQASPDRLDALVWALSELSSGYGGCRAILA